MAGERSVLHSIQNNAVHPIQADKLVVEKYQNCATAASTGKAIMIKRSKKCNTGSVFGHEDWAVRSPYDEPNTMPIQAH